MNIFKTAEKRFLRQQDGAIDLTRLYTLCVSVFVSSTSTSLKAVQPLVSGPSNQIAVVFGGREVVRNTLRRQTVLNGGSRALPVLPTVSPYLLVRVRQALGVGVGNSVFVGR